MQSDYISNAYIVLMWLPHQCAKNRNMSSLFLVTGNVIIDILKVLIMKGISLEGKFPTMIPIPSENDLYHVSTINTKT